MGSYPASFGGAQINSQTEFTERLSDLPQTAGYLDMLQFVHFAGGVRIRTFPGPICVLLLI